ncbi:MAG: acylphosphatase [Phormidium sp. BM_Day4_Bin.17]|nr:acylphosphatase [Phormidium sp. BM_Day4_Bin.17]UCJ13367.1 MAG: acylphosphatase [Phormidium sp. PBR-2020]
MTSQETLNDLPTTAIRVLISGRVQGVGFRYSTQQKAQELGISGWVRNRRNGAVEAVFEGAPTSVQTAVAWCHHGPPTAEVTHVETFREATQDLCRFDIRPTT